MVVGAEEVVDAFLLEVLGVSVILSVSVAVAVAAVLISEEHDSEMLARSSSCLSNSNRVNGVTIVEKLLLELEVILFEEVIILTINNALRKPSDNTICSVVLFVCFVLVAIRTIFLNLLLLYCG